MPLSCEVRKTLSYLLPYRYRILAVLGLSLLSALLSLVAPLLAKFALDEVFPSRRQGLLWGLAALALTLFLLLYLLGALHRYLHAQVTSQVLADMRLSLYRHLQGLSPRFYSRTKVGEILSRINGDLAEVQGIVTDGLLNLTTQLLTLVGAVGFLLYLNPRLFLISASLLPLGALSLKRLRPRVPQAARQIREIHAQMGSHLLETFTGIRCVQAYGKEVEEAQRLEGENRALIRALLRLQVLLSLSGGVPGLLFSLTALIATVYGGHLVMKGEMTLGELAAFIAYQGRAWAPLQGLVGLHLALQRARASLQRVYELFDTRPEIEEGFERSVPRRPGQKAGIRDQGSAKTISNPWQLTPDNCLGPALAGDLWTDRNRIELKEVSFSYEPGETVLAELSFVISRGGTLAIVGPSGAGKSTLCDLLLRFFDPTAGSIEVDGRDLRSLPLSEWRGQLALAGQEDFLFHASIAENIEYGRSGASFEEVVSAARAAAIHEFISGLPQGYATPVGERGTRLSEGQRQRITLARAILRDPPILILDEATSSLDRPTEKQIHEALRALRRERTTIVITHRLSSIREADQILVLDGGRIVQRGRHEALLREKGLYRRMAWDEQRRRAEEERGETPIPIAEPRPTQWEGTPSGMGPLVGGDR
ncbi:MAG: ABC transporter ATP-binding protein [Nitrospinae bacterium]|nr:ABC transporter ATP-binding protein [Nitrospinota bacterium]